MKKQLFLRKEKPQKYLSNEYITVLTIDVLETVTKIFEQNDTLVIQSNTENLQFADEFYIDDLIEDKTELGIYDLFTNLFKHKLPKFYVYDYTQNSNRTITTIYLKPVENVPVQII